jgi:hypothetical protein
MRLDLLCEMVCYFQVWHYKGYKTKTYRTWHRTDIIMRFWQTFIWKWRPPFQNNTDTGTNKDDDITDKYNTEEMDNAYFPSAVLVCHTFTGDQHGLWQKKAPHITKDCTPHSIFMLFFVESKKLLVEEPNWYYYQYLDALDEGQSPLPEATIQEMYSCLALKVHKGHDQMDMLKDYWSTL